MWLGDWLRRVFGRNSKLRNEMPEVMGHFIDERGQKVEVHRGPIRHESLSDDQFQRIGRLRYVLSEAYPMTLDGWLDGFMRDADPESEIRTIEACAVVYQRLVVQASLSPAEMKRLYAVLCAISAGGRGPDLESALPAGKGLPRVETIVQMYREAAQSGSRP